MKRKPCSIISERSSRYRKVIKKDDPSENVVKYLPLYSLMAYVFGAFIFFFYFTGYKANEQVNFFAYLQVSDHLVMFAIGIILFMFTTIAIWPSVLIHKSSHRNIIIISLIIILASLVGFLKIEGSSEVSMQVVISIIYIIIIIFSCFVLILTHSEDDFNWLLFRVFLLAFGFTLYLSPLVVRFAGYGNQWACIALTEKEVRLLKKNPQFKELVSFDGDGYGYTNKKVFILLRLRDHLFIAPKKDEAAIVSVLPAEEVRPYNVSNNLAPENCR